MRIFFVTDDERSLHRIERMINLLSKVQDLECSTFNISKAADLRLLNQGLQEEIKTLLCIYGDSCDLLQIALKGYYRHFPIALIESGHRTFDLVASFPHEMNRRLLSTLANLHFCTTEANRENLRCEGITAGINIVGDLAIDVFYRVISMNHTYKNQGIEAVLKSPKRNMMVCLDQLKVSKEDVMHIFEQAQGTMENLDNWNLIMCVNELKLGESLHFEGGAYRGSDQDCDFYNLLARADLLITDVVDLQVVGPAARTPVIVVSDSSDRPESVLAGVSRVVGSVGEAFMEMASIVQGDMGGYEAMVAAINPYGDGFASERIVDAILEHLGLEPLYRHLYFTF